VNNLSLTIPRTLALIDQALTAKDYLGIQLYISSCGELVVDTGIGESRPGMPMRSDTIMPWMSATKPIVAVAAALLWQEGQLKLDAPVTDYIREFSGGQKDSITVRHLLTHTAGIRNSEIQIRGLSSMDSIVQRICRTSLEPGWIPGKKAGYHVSASWYVLAEIVHRVDGRPIGEYVRRQIFGPLGMCDSWIGIPPDEYARLGQRIGFMYSTEAGPPRLQDLHSERSCGTVSPGGGGRGPIRELGSFYEMLLNRGTTSAGQLLTPMTVEAITSRHRSGMKDHTFQHVMDWGLGFQVDSNIYGAETVPYGYGRYCSPRTYGHGGRQSSSSFADPENQLVVALVMNGMPGERRHTERIRNLNSAIYEDLGLN
jgi:CubicO group peptidase (beta-lactamase class C family)